MGTFSIPHLFDRVEHVYFFSYNIHNLSIHICALKQLQLHHCNNGLSDLRIRRVCYMRTDLGPQCLRTEQ